MEPFIFIIPIGIVVYFVIYGLTEKRIENERRRIFNSILGAVLISPVLYFLFFVGLMLIMTIEGSRNFTREDWLSATEEENSKYQMADDLIETKLLLNKDSLEVKDIIGKTQSRDKNTWKYYLGFGGGFGFVDHELEITYINSKVVNVKHIRIRD